MTVLEFHRGNDAYQIWTAESGHVWSFCFIGFLLNYFSSLKLYRSYEDLKMSREPKWPVVNV